MVNSRYNEALGTSILPRYKRSFVISEVICMNNATCGPKNHFVITGVHRICRLQWVHQYKSILLNLVGVCEFVCLLCIKVLGNRKLLIIIDISIFVVFIKKGNKK